LVRQMGRQLRVVETLDDLAARGVEVIESVHPERFDERGGESMESPGGRDPSDSRLVRSKGPRGVVVRINEASLVEDADAAEAVVELIAAPGSFVSREEPLFRVYPAGAPLSDDRLRTGVAYSDERTLEDDPLYAVRLTVDVAVRALSAAVNDPTTAIQALDRLEELLAFAGRRRLRGGAFLGAGGRLRLIVPRPRWEDYLDTGLTEIRQSGEGQIQVARRMSALLDGLRAALPEPRHEAIDRHRRLLALSVERSFETQEERELATIADPEGLGAPRLERGPASG